MKYLISSVFFSFFIAFFSQSETIELFTGQSSSSQKDNPKVLILFDTSTSMWQLLSIKKPFDSEKDYPPLKSNHSRGDRLYYRPASASAIKADDSDERRYIPANINGCHTAKEAIKDTGFYTGYIRHYSFQGSTGAWRELPATNGASIKLIDCLDDIALVDPANGKIRGSSHKLSDGFPINGEGTENSPQYYTLTADQAAATRANDETYFDSGELVTLYSDRYLRWLDGVPSDDDITTKSRLEVAQESMEALIRANQGVDFALQIFNSNSEGGRIVNGFVKSTADQRDLLIDRIKKFEYGGDTPLCESLYEASLYFGGKPVKFGKFVDSDNTEIPTFDPDIFNGESYESPFVGCSKEIFIIIVTDGRPSDDNSANSDISQLAGIGPISPYILDIGPTYLAELAKWMHTHDLLTGKTVLQTDVNARANDYSKIKNATTYTVGFALTDGNGEESELVKLLKLTAQNGGGDFYEANNPSNLLASLQSILNKILITPASVTAPTIASNSFDRTQTLDSVYYSMFLPNEGPRWRGNIKKFKATATGIVDRMGNDALDSDGNIKNNASSFWGNGAPDGGSVSHGGVAQALQDASSRKVFSDLSGSSGVGTLVELTKSTIKSGLNLNSERDLADKLDVNISEISSTLNWLRGHDVDDDNNNNNVLEYRTDVFGDPVNSKPVVINYGGSESSPILRLFVGTNQGMLHAFNDAGDSVSEAWAFYPKVFLPKISKLRKNIPASQKNYGIDGPITAYVTDVDNTGTVGDNDDAWLFFGLRRGGSSYYALDVSNKDEPVLKWRIDATGDFSGMGQTWSKPKIAFSKLNIQGEKAKPVLIFGAGYSTAKDSYSRTGSNDSVGVGIYMVDADSGELIWRLSPESGSKTTTFSGTDSIPSAITTLDSDGDGYVDRLYAGDTGGNVWRIDMPSKEVSEISVIKLASFSDTDEEGHAKDRRFFSEPTVVRALMTETIATSITENGTTRNVVRSFTKAFDAVLLGSGDINNPLSNNNDDAFFMIKDENIITQTFTSATAPDVITQDKLMDYTDDPFKNLSDDDRQDEQVKMSKKSGWYYNFIAGDGEKSMSSAAVIAGVAYFNSFTPNNSSASQMCSIGAGESALYAVDLSLGTKVYRTRRIVTGFNPSGPPTIISVDRPLEEGADPTIKKKDLVLIAPNITPLCDGSNCENESLQIKTMRTYLYTQEH